MTESVRQIQDLLHRVRSRWRRLLLFRAAARSGLAVTGVLALALTLGPWMSRSPAAIGGLALVALVAAVAATVWGVAPLAITLSDVQMARLVEERNPRLEDRLASAVDVLRGTPEAQRSRLANLLLADVAGCAKRLDPAAMVRGTLLRRAGLQALAAWLLLLLVGYAGRSAALQSWDAVALLVVPSKVVLRVTPGSVAVQAGGPVTIEARLSGNRAPMVVRVMSIGQGDTDWRSTEMRRESSGAAFRVSLPSVAAPFHYRVVAGAITSPTFDVTVTRIPYVRRIDVEYRYPPDLAIPPRTEMDGGDVYAPVGTEIRTHIVSDGAASAAVVMADGRMGTVTTEGADHFQGAFKVAGDTSYRVALTDAQGATHPGETEYFIRTVAVRPPDVHLIKPARDKTVAPLDEIDIEARAEDDSGVEGLDLVYAVGGKVAQVQPLVVPNHATVATGKGTLALEDLGVRPGDFLSYYVRLRGATRGRQSGEVRSDIFFVEVRPFEEELVLAPPSGAGNQAFDDLITAQRQVIVATWQLDRRADGEADRSTPDIHAVSQTESELKRRVEEASSAFRESTMRDPQHPGRGGSLAPLAAGETLPEEDAMTAAGMAMGQAVTSLERVKTSDALPSELEALDDLLKAQGAQKQRQVTNQQAGAGSVVNRSNVDTTTRFDKELQRQNRSNVERRENTNGEPRVNRATLLDRIRALARRQDELAQQQQALVQEPPGLSVTARRRELARLTHDESDLQERADEIEQEVSGGSAGSAVQRSGEGQQLREASDEMREAASALRRQDPTGASRRAEQALAALHAVEQRLARSEQDDGRQLTGELQREVQQLAESERETASDLRHVGQGNSATDALRRLAGEQDRLKERAQRAESALKRTTSADPVRLTERMQEVANEIRNAAALDGAARHDAARTDRAARAAAAAQDVAGALDGVAGRLATGDPPRDEDTRRLSQDRARAEALKQEINRLSNELSTVADHASSGGSRGRTAGADAGGARMAQLRDAYVQQLQRTRDLLRELSRTDPSVAQEGAGFTFDGQGMTLSAPGTQAFKQDFARWQQLREEATEALERAETVLSNALQAREASVRLAAGTDDKAPASYQSQVASYFAALAKKQP